MKQFSTRLGARLVAGMAAVLVVSVPSPTLAAPSTSPVSQPPVAAPTSLATVVPMVSVGGDVTETVKKSKKRKKKKCRSSEARGGKAAEKNSKKCHNKTKKKRKKKRKPRLGVRAMKVAAAQAGDPYVYGATGPNAFDCSGLTSYSFKRAGKTIPRTSSAQRGAARHVKAKHRRVGDLVFFHGSSGVYHVGIYAGKNRLWHAPSTGRSVTRENIWTSSVSYGRIG